MVEKPSRQQGKYEGQAVTSNLFQLIPNNEFALDRWLASYQAAD